MAYQPGTGFSGAWARRTQVDLASPLANPLDPEHLNPTDNPEYTQMRPLWANSAPAPVLPAEMIDPQITTMAGGIGPVDRTPIDHAYGMGTGPGLSTLQSQDYRSAWHMDDQGANAALRYQPMVDRDDRPGSPHADFIQHDPFGGDSPQTLQLERTGPGQPNDPNARAGKAFRRWRDRYMDPHRWSPEMRPLVPRYARGAQAQPAVPDGNQMTSPYATAVTEKLGVIDKFVAPLVRRQPGPWDEGLASDATGDTIVGALDNYGLTKWGL
jgi:hypothetical protein